MSCGIIDGEHQDGEIRSGAFAAGIGGMEKT
jgi:hypothetical protein